jgi:fatty acid synthase, animal type
LLPAAAYVETALEFPGVTHIFDCRFEAACTLDESAPPTTLEVSKEGNSWSVKSSTALENMIGDLEWTRSGPVPDELHARGKLGFDAPEVGLDAVTKVDVEAVLGRCISTHAKDEYYAEIKRFLQFRPQ